jgi:hypothetical protein
VTSNSRLRYPIPLILDGVNADRTLSGRPMPHKHNDDRRHHIPKMAFKVQNWSAYEAGLRRRGSLTLWIEDGALEHWQTCGPDGQARYTDAAIQTSQFRCKVCFWTGYATYNALGSYSFSVANCDGNRTLQQNQEFWALLQSLEVGQEAA